MFNWNLLCLFRKVRVTVDAPLVDKPIYDVIGTIFGQDQPGKHDSVLYIDSALSLPLFWGYMHKLSYSELAFISG